MILFFKGKSKFTEFCLLLQNFACFLLSRNQILFLQLEYVFTNQRRNRWYVKDDFCVLSNSQNIWDNWNTLDGLPFVRNNIKFLDISGFLTMYIIVFCSNKKYDNRSSRNYRRFQKKSKRKQLSIIISMFYSLSFETWVSTRSLTSLYCSLYSRSLWNETERSSHISEKKSPRCKRWWWPAYIQTVLLQRLQRHGGGYVLPVAGR